MIDNKEKNRIIKFIRGGSSDYKIGKDLKHSPNTIKVIREELKKTEEGQSQLEEEEYSTIDEMRKFTDHLGDLIKKGQLKDKKRKEIEKIYKNLREILKTEVDDHVKDEITKAIKQRDLDWTKIVEQNYVKKDIVTNLNNELKEKDRTIENLNSKIKEKDEAIDNQQDEIEKNKISYQEEKNNYKNSISDINIKFSILTYDYNELVNTISYRYYNDVGKKQDELKRERESFENDKREFKKNADEEVTKIIDSYYDIKMLMENIKQYEENLKKLENKINKVMEEIPNIQKDSGNIITETTKRYNLLDEKENQIYTEEKILKEYQEKVYKGWEDIKRLKSALEIWEQKLQTLQQHLNETSDLNKFILPCPSCKKDILLNITDPETYQKISKAFEDYMHPECIEKEKLKNTFLTQVISSAELTTLQSGDSSTIQSGGNTIVVKCSGEPVVQLESPINNITSTEIKGYYCSGDPIIQSKLSLNIKLTPDSKLVNYSGEPINQSGYNSSN